MTDDLMGHGKKEVTRQSVVSAILEDISVRFCSIHYKDCKSVFLIKYF